MFRGIQYYITWSCFFQSNIAPAVSKFFGTRPAEPQKYQFVLLFNSLYVTIVVLKNLLKILSSDMKDTI